VHRRKITADTAKSGDPSRTAEGARNLLLNFCQAKVPLGLVVAGKISGGTRSSKGSETRMGLASLFGTWMAQHLNPFYQCLATLIMKSSLGQI